ncbi:thiosulfate sulfurtransferase [Chelatococcus reniformis]|uniref:Thiosulfate sulfurtransferase n=1 Tax=Chelatococcus reniformis TaxID=1494448 RepID=A0A916UAC8_9HYPH|nr:thiosulfate sulfurtransferase [Chelatococcus reniformis]
MRAGLLSGEEIALLDVREEKTFAARHLLLAASAPLSRIELLIADLVPRLTTPIVLCDAGEGLADRAKTRLSALGYTNIDTLDGGIDAWEREGGTLFSGVHVPSKAFGEFVETTYHTPSIGADELRARLERGEPTVILDSRPFTEYEVMNIPGGINMPGAELVHRLDQVPRADDALIVVNCAGRTRSIIGAQSLINAGTPGRVVALRNGTMGWELAGLSLEHGSTRAAPLPSPERVRLARERAAAVARRFGVTAIDAATLDAWRAERHRRSLYVFDVRQPDEYAAGHLADAVNAAGGQLVQETDRYVGARGARIVLFDPDEVRAVMTASWLIQMGWREVRILTRPPAGETLVSGPRPAPVLGLESARPATIDAAGLEAELASGQVRVIDLALSRAYKAGHIPGAVHAVRARLVKAVAAAGAAPLVLTSDDGILATLASGDPGLPAGTRVLAGGTAAWIAAGLPTVGAPLWTDEPDDIEPKPFEVETNLEQAMRNYLSWEIDLVDRLKLDGTLSFKTYPKTA